MKIKTIKGIEIFDSRGFPTLEVKCVLDTGQVTTASVPAGAFASLYEAIPTKDVASAIRNIDGVIAPSLVGQDPTNQNALDQLILNLDGTPKKEHLGANTLLGVSMAIARAGALSKGIALASHLRQIFGVEPKSVKVSPMFNVINGGAHADNNLTFQEFMVVPLVHELPFIEKMNQGRNIFSLLRKRLEEMGKSTNVGEEGGFAPELNSNEEAVEILVETIQEAGFKPGVDIGIALDVAAEGIPDLLIATYPKQPGDFYKSLTSNYPIISLEDPFSNNDLKNWVDLTKAIGSQTDIVGDDFFATNPERLKLGIENHAGNSISIKPNQIGTVSETLGTIKMALDGKIKYQISHRSGETEDTFIADLAIATGAQFIKAGAPNRGERLAKYNQIIRLEAGYSD